MWFEKSAFYHIYPLGFCGALDADRTGGENRIGKIAEWIPHMQKIGINALYLGPVFESDRHGYDTVDYNKIDGRLGTNADFADVCHKLHDAGIKVVLDGVFNHVGRGFVQFKDVVANRESSPYKDWFKISFDGNSNYNDGLWYEGWEGHFELVKLNLQNHEVAGYIFNCIKGWIVDYDIDGLRLDVAYCLDREFVKKLRQFCKSIKPDFLLLGECLHGDYNQFVSHEMLDSCTNYECYKGLYSSFNDSNMFEIAYSINRQFGAEHWTLYKGKHLLNFVDNHDVSRIASILKEEKHIPLIYGLMFAMPGVPCIYYGSEWGINGEKSNGDEALRPAPDSPVENSLSEIIAKLCKIKTSSDILAYGGYRQIALTNCQYAFEREYNGSRIVFAVNISGDDCDINLGMSFTGTELITEKTEQVNGTVKLAAYSVAMWELK